MKTEKYGPEGAPAVLCLHSFLMGPFMWQETARELSGQGLRVLAPCLSGHGGDEGEFEGLEAEANRMLELVQQEAPGGLLAVCGAGLGAEVAIELIAAHPALVQNAVLETVLISSKKGHSAATAAAHAYFEAAQKGLLKKPILSLLKLAPSLQQEALENFRQVSSKSFQNGLSAQSEFVLPGALSRCKTKVLVLCGSKQMSELQQAATQLAAARRTSTRMIEGCARSYCEQDPIGYAVMVRHFLTGKR